MKETFIKKYVLERTNKADIRPEEQSEKMESCWENLWNQRERERKREREITYGVTLAANH